MSWEVVAMDGNPTRGQGSLQVQRAFEQNRLAGQFLAESYERVVPIRRMAISPGGRIDGQDTEQERKLRGLGSASTLVPCLPSGD